MAAFLSGFCILHRNYKIMTSQFFTYDKGKVIQALRYHFITRKEIKIMIVVVNVFTLIAGTLCYFKKISPLAFLGSSVLWFALMIVFLFVLPIIIYKKSETFKATLKVTITDTQFTIENDRGNRRWPWKDFSNWMESPHFFHLYFDSRSFFIIPKDAFEEHELKDVRKILNTGIGK